jgi:Sec-independent protein translocase protein TatA
MEFLGIGPLELFFILLIALIVLGPKDMVKAGKTIGRFLRRVVTSPNWRALQQASREIRHLPEKLMREAGLEEIQKELPDAQTIRRQIGIEEMQQDLSISEDLSPWTTPPNLTKEDPLKEEIPPRESQEHPDNEDL